MMCMCVCLHLPEDIRVDRVAIRPMLIKFINLLKRVRGGDHLLVKVIFWSSSVVIFVELFPRMTRRSPKFVTSDLDDRSQPPSRCVGVHSYSV